jgi:hypothetical protein
VVTHIILDRLLELATKDLPPSSMGAPPMAASLHTQFIPAAAPINATGRSFTATAGALLDVADTDAVVLSPNGWTSAADAASRPTPWQTGRPTWTPP